MTEYYNPLHHKTLTYRDHDDMVECLTRDVLHRPEQQKGAQLIMATSVDLAEPAAMALYNNPDVKTIHILLPCGESGPVARMTITPVDRPVDGNWSRWMYLLSIPLDVWEELYERRQNSSWPWQLEMAETPTPKQRAEERRRQRQRQQRRNYRSN